MAVNPWLEQKLELVHSPRTINLIVEVDDSARLSEVRRDLSAVSGVAPGRSAFNMVQVTAPPETVTVLSRIPGVTIHYDSPYTIRFSPPQLFDPLIGPYRASAVTIPVTPQQAAAQFLPRLAVGLATFPFRVLGAVSQLKTPLSGLQQPDVIILPSSKVQDVLEIPENNIVNKTKVAVLDTGVGYPHPLLPPTKGMIKMGTFAGPVPLDGLGHGTWVTTAGFGGFSPTRFGLCKGVADLRNSTLGSWKVLSDVGFGSTFGIIQGIEAAYKWGAKVVSMSLGSELQGTVGDDPTCKIIERLKDEIIFVVAAGNEGPGDWTIGSPGASPYAVTVGAYSSYYNGLALFSSRGPNASWYRDRGGASHPDFRAHGNSMIKPDVLAPGGGPVENGQNMDLIYSGVVGWMDGIYDLTPLDGYGPMRGTSMATPMAAGIIALAIENGYIKTASDVKVRMAKHGVKNKDTGYGIISYKKLQ